MRISDMLQREDFYSVLQESIKEYYHKVHNKEVNFSYLKESCCDKLIVNGKLSFISKFPAPEGLRRFLLTEYNVRGNRLRFVIGKAAALLVWAIPQVGMVRKAYLTAGVLGKNTFINPQNRSVRFFDYDTMTVDCIIKNGFTDKYFANQLAFRKEYNYDFMLPLLDSGESWFREPILLGHPLARVTDEDTYKKGMSDALMGIGQLVADTLSYTDSVAYGCNLKDRLFALLEQAANRKRISSAEQTRALVKLAWEDIAQAPIEVPLCMSHGDFQSGNIWVDENGKTWIYDWETVAKRSIWYDSSVLCYSLRRAYGWQELWNDQCPTAMCSCDPVKNRDGKAYEAMKRIVLLEDILFYLEDMLELPEDWGKEIYDANIQRMSDFLLLQDERKMDQ